MICSTKCAAEQTRALGDGKDPQFENMARRIEVTWPGTSGGTIRINRDIADENKLMRYARVFYVWDEKDWRGNFLPFRVHTLAKDLLNVHVDGVSGYADEGWFALSTGHGYFREIELCGDVQTLLIDADAYEGDVINEAVAVRGNLCHKIQNGKSS